MRVKGIECRADELMWQASLFTHGSHMLRLELEQSKMRKDFEARLITQQQMLLAAKNADVDNLNQRHEREQVRDGGGVCVWGGHSPYGEGGPR